MRRLQKVEPGITDLSLSEALQELLAVLRHNLGGQLDRLIVDVRDFRVLDSELIGRRRLYHGFGLFELAITKELLSQHALVVLLRLLLDRLNLLGFLGLLLTLLELFEIIGSVRVVFILQEIELRVVMLVFQNQLLELVAVWLGDALS